MKSTIKIIGAGLAGCEAANYLANKGYKVKLFEKRPKVNSPAHHSDLFGELVCSNSLKSKKEDNACGILKEEINLLGSLMMEASRHSEVPGGDSLAVDRTLFASYITNKIKSNKNIEISYENVEKIDPDDGYTLICTGPLTDETLLQEINKISGENVIYTVGSPHRITAEKLQKSKEEWQNAFSDLPRPLTAVIIGGKIKGKGFSVENAIDFAEKIKNFQQKKGGSLLITDSHRTGKEAENKMLEILKDIPSYKYLWGSHEKNPYMGYLACADNIIVSGDSVSMCCEACGAGKPVYIYSGTNWLTPKHQRFVDSLIDSNHAASLEKGQYSLTAGEKFNPAAELVKAIENL